MANRGAIFMRNYLSRDWQTDRQQDYWTMTPMEDRMDKVLVLYQYRDDIEPAYFRNMQLVFEVTIHEEHPYKAPTIKVLTPNGRMQQNVSICIDGLTAWHPESWNIIATFNSIVERFALAYIDVENVTSGAGFMSIDQTQIAKYAETSKNWNSDRYPELFALFEEQCEEFYTALAIKGMTDVYVPCSKDAGAGADAETTHTRVPDLTQTSVPSAEYEYEYD